MGACCGGAQPPTALEMSSPHGTLLTMLFAEYHQNEGTWAQAWEITIEGIRSAIAGTANGTDKDTGSNWKAYAKRDLKFVNIYFGVSNSHYVLMASPKDDSTQIHCWCSLNFDEDSSADGGHTRANRQHFFDKLSMLQTIYQSADGVMAAGRGVSASSDAKKYSDLMTWERTEFLIASDGFFDQTRKFSQVWSNRSSITSYQDLSSFFAELDAEMEWRKKNPPAPQAGGHRRNLTRSMGAPSKNRL